jgi:hypothetical protein
MTLDGDYCHAYDESCLLMRSPQQIRTRRSVYGRCTLERLPSSAGHFLARRSKRKTGSRRTSCGRQTSRVYIRGRMPNRSSRASYTPSTYNRMGQFGSLSLTTLSPRFRSPSIALVRELFPLLTSLSPRTLRQKIRRTSLELLLRMLKYLRTVQTLTPLQHDTGSFVALHACLEKRRRRSECSGGDNLCDTLARQVGLSRGKPSAVVPIKCMWS